VTELHWLTKDPEWHGRLQRFRTRTEASEEAWTEAISLANSRLDFIGTNSLDASVRRLFKCTPADLTTPPIRLAVLGSSTLSHLLAGIRVAAIRRGFWVSTYENDYGQYLQELSNPNSTLYSFQPNCVLIALDAYHLSAGINASLAQKDVDEALTRTCSQIERNWQFARESLGCSVIQQTALPLHSPLFGSNEQRLPGSRAAYISRLNAALRTLADRSGVDLLALDERAARDGLYAWHDPVLWLRSKQEVSPRVGPMYGDLVCRVLAARQGKAFKCLVLDLDNTIWGGVIGDDGVDGIVVGQGNPLGEAYIAIQHYAKEQARRGVILAVCSKNDEETALEPFQKHPDMLLKRADIACFVANWNDKATNIRRIADQLNIGLDAMVFVDDNPAERALIRKELPMVAVPEIPEDPALVVPFLADAGYFEAVSMTLEDRERAIQYQQNANREALRTASTDISSYLQGLQMALLYRTLDLAGLARAVQLINKTNQFNLTTRRYAEDEVRRIISDERALGLQFRLLDVFGDNGVIAIVICRTLPDNECLLIDSWLMSCRVLGRQVEQATLNVVIQHAMRMGAKRLIGEYHPTKKNGMVKDHYEKLGFQPTEGCGDGVQTSVLDLISFVPLETSIDCREE
jgi:FkbH-like protein